jgi:hypothetical protein
MTTPAGVPAWLRQASASTYGGHPNKRNYQSVGPVNPETDVDAAEFIRMSADMASVARVATFCSATIVCDDSTPGAPTVSSINQMTAVSTAGYLGDSPSHASFPTVERVSNGKVQATWPSSATDDYGVSGDITIRHVRAWVIGAAAYASVKVTVDSSTEVSFEAVDAAGAAISNATICFEVS